jgi:sugar phosphate isomerase/epimerase
MSLDPGAIGVQVSQLALIKLAKQHGFEAVTPYPSFLTDHAQEAVTALQENSLVWGVAGLPVEFRQDKARFERDLSALPRLAQALQEAGGTRMSTWIMPTHAELNYLKNFQQHTDRLRQVAEVLNDHNVRLGLEYVGPKTLRDSQKYAFVSTLEETQTLIAELKHPNVGVVLDSFHWYTAEEAVDDILTLTNQDVVACDLNDAHRGRGPREQIDGERELPLATGIIPTKEFLQALVKINYDGPVRAEPFNQALNELDDQTAVANTEASLRQAFELIN